MVRPYLPLNGLRAFEAAARHLSFTRAAIELCVTQAAISQQVKGLEERLGRRLFRRLPRGLALTDEGLALLPAVAESLDRLGDALERVGAGRPREVVNVGVVGTFATGCLLPRISTLAAVAPHLEVRLFTNNNRVDLAAEGLDCAIRFGDGSWHATHAEWLMDAALSPLCAPGVARRLSQPHDLLSETLLRSYRADEWARWFDRAGLAIPPLRGPVFDSSLAMVEAAEMGLGVALAPASMFSARIARGALVQPFGVEAPLGGYWLTWLKSKAPTPGLMLFREWLHEECRRLAEQPGRPRAPDLSLSSA
ncbi:LysR substrate-binding domain-containing protein [Phenylobacterium terrae]|uniref:LysR substrate-binding domain-containing protein n=1 Tax=Phenylobacterium terrae TaxID=2665495 RepID=A0ABW4N3W4_9CAUL